IVTGIIAGGNEGGSTPGPGPPTPGPGSSNVEAGGRLCALGNTHPVAVIATASDMMQSNRRIFMVSPLTIAVAADVLVCRSGVSSSVIRASVGCSTTQTGYSQPKDCRGPG